MELGSPVMPLNMTYILTDTICDPYIVKCKAFPCLGITFKAKAGGEKDKTYNVILTPNTKKKGKIKFKESKE